MENAACHFVFYTGPRKGEAQAFHTARISVGRASGCDFRLEAFQLDQVGSHHAEVLLEDGNVYCLYDLGTKSGTYVNGERVHDKCTLMHEDYIRFGQDGPEVIFRTGEPMPGKQPLPQIFPVMAELEFFSGSDAGRIFPINAGVVSNIGRRADLEIPLDPRGDMIVSGNHCNIRYINGHFVLTDSSRNGTYVNGDLVDQPMEILDGDVLMMGDGGPRARFHVDEAKRHYPNHRPLSPVVKKEQEKERPAESAFSKRAAEVAGGAGAAGAAGAAGTGAAGAAGASAAAASAAAAASMASAKPYSSGGTPLPGMSNPPVPPPAAATDGAVDEDVSMPPPDASGAASTGHGSEFDAESVAADVEVDSTAAALAAEPSLDPGAGTGAPPNGPRAKRSLSAAVPALHKLKFKPGKKVILGAIAVVVLIGLIAIFTSGDDTPSASANRSNYEKQLEELVTLNNASGGYNVKVPDGWTNLNRENFVSTESKDKKVAVDYVRDPALNEAQVREMLSRNGATIDAKADERTVDGVKVKTLKASAGNVRRVAALHQATGAPAMAFLETSEDAMEKLDKDALETLLVSNLTLVGPGPAGAPTPAPAATATPATADASPALPVPSAATPTPAAVAAAPTATPAATASATPNADTATTRSGNAVASKALKLSVVPPEGWTGVSEEADAMITLSNGKGLDIRIARDPGELDAKLTFDAMADEGWEEDGRKTDRANFKAGEFHQKDQNLMLVLIPEKAKTTVVIYATSEQDFTTQQRYEIMDVVQQLAGGQ